jgi:hypothetical protein
MRYLLYPLPSTEHIIGCPLKDQLIDNPMEEYYKSLSPGEELDPDQIIVAMESSAVYSVFGLIDNSQKRECILDSRCQIIAMSKTSCCDLELMYNLVIILHMQSANKNINQSLGSSCNVLFWIGPITFYFQVHIIQSPAYDVLLGCPFDVLMKSVVHNFANENQRITIHDPKTSHGPDPS